MPKISLFTQLNSHRMMDLPFSLSSCFHLYISLSYYVHVSYPRSFTKCFHSTVVSVSSSNCGSKARLFICLSSTRTETRTFITRILKLKQYIIGSRRGGSGFSGDKCCASMNFDRTRTLKDNTHDHTDKKNEIISIIT